MRGGSQVGIVRLVFYTKNFTSCLCNRLDNAYWTCCLAKAISINLEINSIVFVCKRLLQILPLYLNNRKQNRRLMTERPFYFEFHYATLTLEPYAGSNSTSSLLLQDVITKLNDKDLPDSLREIDRYKNRQGSAQRRLVHIAAPFEKGGVRCFGRIALIKDKAPLFLHGKDTVEEILKPQNKRFIELTNYVINFSASGDPIIMVEFNSAGPRLSDIEFYLRQISKEYKIATAFKTSIHLEASIDDLGKRIDNVFNLTVKVANTFSTTASAEWFNIFTSVRNNTAYKDVKLELFFGRSKNQSTGRMEKNVGGLKFVRRLLDWVNKDNTNLDNLDDLKMEYTADDSDDVISLDFLKNKKTSSMHIPSHGGVYKPSELKHFAGQEFNHYLTTGKTNMVDNHDA